MENALLRQNPHWQNAKYENIYFRSVYKQLLLKKELPHIQVLTGIRRSGKSSIFRLLINDLLDRVDPREILVLNMDEPAFTPIWNNAGDLYSVIELAEKLVGHKIQYLFLDEIQQVKEWELFAKSAYDSQIFKKIYITGSNSNLLNNTFSALLSGRYFANTVRPFSWSEILTIHGVTDRLTLLSEKMKVLRLLDASLKWGSFPEIVVHPVDDSVKSELLKSYYDSVVLKDCIAYNQIRDGRFFYQLLYFVFSNIGKTFTYSSLSKAVRSNENTVRNYLNFAEQSFISADVTNFSFSLKEGARPLRKTYAIDNGLINAVSYSFSGNKGSLLENMVYNELINNGYTDISFSRDCEECDFIARNDQGFHAFQICYELTDGNKRRELYGFSSIHPDIEVASKKLITYNQKETVGDIEVVPVWDIFGGLSIE